MAGASCVSDVGVGLVTAAGAEDELDDEEDICRQNETAGPLNFCAGMPRA